MNQKQLSRLRSANKKRLATLHASVKANEDFEVASGEVGEEVGAKQNLFVGDIVSARAGRYRATFRIVRLYILYIDDDNWFLKCEGIPVGKSRRRRIEIGSFYASDAILVEEGPRDGAQDAAVSGEGVVD